MAVGILADLSRTRGTSRDAEMQFKNLQQQLYFFLLMSHLLGLVLALLISPTVAQCPLYSTKLCSFQFVAHDCLFANCTVFAEGANQTQSIAQDWDLCLASCCDGAEASKEHSLDSLRMTCPMEKQEDQEQDVMSLLGFGFALGLVLMLLIYCYCHGLDQLKLLFFTNNTQKHTEVSTVQFKNIEQTNHGHIINFLTTEEAVEHRQNRTCSICLEDKTSVRASCGHQFHAPCIIEWYKRKQECPECRQTGKKALTLLCTCCHKESMAQTLSVGDFTSHSCS